MATAPNQQSDVQDISSKKPPRRSVIRSLSWKRANKRTKMEEDDVTVENREEVDASFNTTATSTAHGMSDEDADDSLYELDSTGATSKKRKKIGLWKAAKRFFSRKSGKSSKSFAAGDSRSHHGHPQRSVSDPNLAHRTGERPELAPLEQVDETAMETKVSPKKAMSHDSLFSELRSKQAKNVDGEKQTSPKPSGVDWKASPGSTPENLLPGLNVSHDKIRVAPRHRRAPTRKGVASVRHGGRDITDANVIPRSKSVGARIQNTLLEEPQVETNELKAVQQEKENQKIRKEIEEEQRQRKQKEEEEQKQKLEIQKLEQKKLEMEKIEREKLEQQRLEQEKLEQERLEKQKIEEEKLKQENLEKRRLEQQKREEEKLEQKRFEQKKLEEEKLKREKVEQEKLEQEKQRLEKQEKLEKQKIEQEKVQKEILEREKGEEQKREKEDELKQQENYKLNEYNVQQTTDFSDLVESLRPSGDSKDAYRKETTEVEIKETTLAQKPDPLADIGKTSAVDTHITGVALYQNVDIAEEDVKVEESDTIEEQNTPAVLDLGITNIASDKQTEDNSQTASDFAVSPAEDAAASANQSVKLPATDERINEVNTIVTVEEENVPPLSPSPATSPVRSKRLVIETPEKVYQKPIMAEVRAEEATTSENSDGPKGIRHDRPQSMHSRITPKVEEKNQTQDDSNAGVAKLTQAFERSHRSNTISYSERKKRPEVLPKPKVPSKPSQSQTLERNYRFPVPSDTETSGGECPTKQNDGIVVLDDVAEKKVETMENVLSSPTKKIPPKPKPLPKPKIKPRKPDLTTKTAEEVKQNIKRTPNAQSVTNGSVKMSSTDSTDGKVQTGDVSKDNQADLPSFWARRSIFSPEQKANHSTSLPDTREKTKDKHTPFIQLKTDTCAVCGSKVYQMEKFKVKDNIVHRSCIKCSVCKRLLSVGNFIMSQNKIYCKPHEPHLSISLTTF